MDMSRTSALAPKLVVPQPGDVGSTVPQVASPRPNVALPVREKIRTEKLTVFYNGKEAIKSIDLSIPEGMITAIIGPSGCGKSTFLRALNRMNELIPGTRTTGKVLIDGVDIYDPAVDLPTLRKNVGMVWQRPNPFPKTIWENVAYGPKCLGVKSKAVLDDIVEKSLREAALWDEVKDRLHSSALALSGGQQQRLCIARALAVEPSVLLMDEPAASLDPISTTKIEDLMAELRGKYTLVIVTHNMQQAARVSDYTAFLLMGELVEFDVTERIFTRPKRKETEDYITGRFG